MLRRVALALIALAVLRASAAHAVTWPTDFVSESAAPGATFTVPTAIAFTPAGRILVTEKRGRVYAIRGGAKEGPLIDLSAEVLENGDRGLLGIAVDPEFTTNRYVYLLYTVDPDSNGVDNDNDAFGRLTRYQVSAGDSTVLDPASRTILLGATWRTGIPRGSDSHSEGALRWGRDGSLLVSCGEGAQYTSPDAGGFDAALFGPNRTDPAEDIGAFRSQHLSSLAGKVLRLDPATGRGYPSNPFYDGDVTSNRSRVWAYGLRNPFRFGVRPGTGSTDPAAGAPGTLYIGDVGWVTYEDLNVARVGGRNFGWPCFEGMGPNAPYQNANPSHQGCSSIGTPSNPSPHAPPVISTHHLGAELSSPPGVIGNSIIGGTFYTADRYPSAYWGAYFFSDYGQNWVRVARFDANDELVSVEPFATSTEGAVDWVAHPLSGDLYYVAIFTGEVRRLRYTGPQPNRAPIAVANASPRAGAKPLAVDFSSAGSSDPDNEALTYAWLFGDGTGASGATVSHIYTFPGHHFAILTADDNRGGESRDTLAIVVTASSSFPTSAVLDVFNRADGSLGVAWGGSAAALGIAAQRVASSGPSAALWNTPAGADQEAFLTLAATAPGARVDLLLKSQGVGLDAPRIRVRHDVDAAQTRVSVWDPVNGWVDHGAPIAGAVSAGQRLGARALANGVVQVWRDTVRLGSVELSDVPLALGGGGIGFGLFGAAAARVDDFGGGNAMIDPDQPPVVEITSPLTGSFFVAGDTLRLRGMASDAEEAADSLVWVWTIELLHNNHVHPNVFTSLSRTPETIAEDHDDGTGVSLRVKLAVSDHAGHTSTVTALVHPEVELSPGPLRVTPDTLGTSGLAQYQFTLHNLGRMPAPRSRWRVIAPGVTIAQGDTSVAAGDSAVVRVRAFAPVAPGTTLLRVVLDTLGTVNEPNEANNSAQLAVTVLNGRTRDALGPLFTLGPTASPAASQAWMRWRTDELSHATLHYGLAPTLTDSVIAAPNLLEHDFVLTGLALGARYVYQIVVRDTLGNTTSAAIDSFQTQTSALDVAVVPTSLALSSAWPNPAQGTVSFALALPHATAVDFAIFDLAGRQVWAAHPRLVAGHHTLQWNGRATTGGALAPGLYLARVRADGLTRVRRFVLVH